MVLVKCFVFMSIVLNIFHRISANELIDPNNGILITPRENTCTGVGAICLDDCETIMGCTAAGADPIPSSGCPSASSPYCVPSATGSIQCTATKSSQCSANSPVSLGFTCTEVGDFPDTTNCAQYHKCIMPNSLSMKYQCPTGQTYDSRLQTCKDGKVICYSTSCPTVPGAVIAFKMNPAYYTLCMGNDRIILRCPDLDNHIWNGSSCVFKCTTKGVFPDVTDPKAFYECKKTTGNAVRHECSTDQIFDGKRCVDEPLEPLG